MPTLVIIIPYTRDSSEQELGGWKYNGKTQASSLVMPAYTNEGVGSTCTNATEALEKMWSEPLDLLVIFPDLQNVSIDLYSELCCLTAVGNAALLRRHLKSTSELMEAWRFSDESVIRAPPSGDFGTRGALKSTKIDSKAVSADLGFLNPDAEWPKVKREGSIFDFSWL
jgi:hypothetical protein